MSNTENEIDFAQAFQESLKEIRSGSVIKGIIAGISNGNIIIDLGFKSDGIMPFAEYSDESSINPEDEIKVGQEIEAYVVRVNDGEGNVLLSRRKVEGMKMWQDIDKWIEEKKSVTAKVVKEVGSGLLANKSDIKIFIPASQLAEKNSDLKSYVGNNITIRILEVDKNKRKVIGSERVIAKEERDKKEAEIWNNIAERQELKGVVKKIEKFGAFIDIGGVDGLIHISELSWGKIKSPSDVLSVGQVVDTYVLNLDKEKKKISLGYRKAADNPWFEIEKKYKVDDVVEVKIERIVPFGAFAQIETGLDGLIHISNISNKRIGTPSEIVKTGDYVKVKIIEIDTEKKKIELSMKELEEQITDMK